MLDTTLCDNVCQRLATGRWFSPCIPVSASINKTNRHDITVVLLKVVLATITLNLTTIPFSASDSKWRNALCTMQNNYHIYVINMVSPTARRIIYNLVIKIVANKKQSGHVSTAFFFIDMK